MHQTLLNFLQDKKWHGFLITCGLGVFVFFAGEIINSSLYDSLVVALFVGIIFRMFLNEDVRMTKGFSIAPAVFIPVGAVLYGAVNLNFLVIQKVQVQALFILLFVIVSYFATILLMGKLLAQKKQITYLVAIGSGICGASAIAVSAPAVDAEPEDISISIISVFTAAVFGLFILFPFLHGLLGLTEHVYAMLSGMTLQFTGFVKAAIANSTNELATLALSIKAARYLILLIAIPVFASLTKRKIYIPWFLWAFLFAGILCTFLIPTWGILLKPTLKILLDVSWSIAMAGIGLSANPQSMFSDNGLKALIMAFTGFVVATAVFIIGISFT